MHRLLPAPDMPHPAVEIAVEVAVVEVGLFRLSFHVTGDVCSIIWPPVTAPERVDELWQHSCFEAFLGLGDGPGYVEMNFAPSRQWAAYRFDDYRQGMQALADFDAPEINVEGGQGDGFALSARFDLSRLANASPISLGLSAVIEDIDGNKSYWALRHPPGPPDFHHRDCFALTLLPPA